MKTVSWKNVEKGIHRATYFVGLLGLGCLVPLMALTSTDVLSRAIFKKPIPGSLELSQYLLSVLILLGAAYTQQVKGHVSVQFLTSRLSRRRRLLCQVLTAGLGLFIVSIMIWQGFVIGLGEKTVSDMLRIPQAPFRLLVAVGGVFLWLELWVDLVTAICNLRRGDP